MTKRVYALVGPYASGKATLIKKLREVGVHYVPAYTACAQERLRKDTSIVNYVAKDAFSQGDWMVKVAYKGDYYGLRKKDMLEALNSSDKCVIVLDQNGVKQISNLLMGHLCTIYLMTDYVSLVDRMLRMGLNNMEMKHHLEYAESNNEFNFWKSADFVIKNTKDINTAFSQLLAIFGFPVLTKRPNKPA